jgi:TonB family protein
MKYPKSISILIFLLHIHANSEAQYKWNIVFLDLTQELAIDTIPPSYFAGYAELFKKMQKEVTYPQIALYNGIHGKVVIQFTVNPDSSITDIKTLRDIGGNFCSNEVIRVLRKLNKWKPVQKNGKPISGKFLLAAVFEYEYIPEHKKKEIKIQEIRE